MKLNLEFGSLGQEEDAKQLAAILGQCFMFSSTERYFQRLGLDNFRVIRQGKRIAGGLARQPLIPTPYPIGLVWDSRRVRLGSFDKPEWKLSYT